MSDYPDRLAIGKCHPFRGNNFYVSDAGVEQNPVEYTRSDLCVTRAALAAAQADYAAEAPEFAKLVAEAVAAERNALVALEKAASEVSRQGAVTGPQWTRLSIAILSARAAIRRAGASHA